MYEGIFIRELKNRFLCEVLVYEEVNTCYVPASCRLSNFGDFSGCKVLLTENLGKQSQTRYSLYAIFHDRKYIIVNLKEANRIIEENLNRRIFSYLGKRKNVIREYKINNYKSDLYIVDSRTVIEIKSVLLFKNNNKIIQVHSERAVSQLKELHKLLGKGYKVCYIFVSMNPTVSKIVLEAQANEYHKWLYTNIKQGMLCKAYAVGISGDRAVLRREIEFQYDELSY